VQGLPGALLRGQPELLRVLLKVLLRGQLELLRVLLKVLLRGLPELLRDRGDQMGDWERRSPVWIVC